MSKTLKVDKCLMYGNFDKIQHTQKNPKINIAYKSAADLKWEVAYLFHKTSNPYLLLTMIRINIKDNFD